MGPSRLYLPGETLFGAIAERSLQLGWTIIPQERGERRISSRIDGRSLKWGEFIERMPTPVEVHHWCNQAPGANGAILLGKPSGLVFCYDIDVTDTELSLAIQHLAEEKLGYTRFARQGQPPKMALFYRVSTEAELPPNKAHKFAGSDDMLEVHAKGKLVTAFGYHHKTDQYFQWEGPQPSTHPVHEVPLVTPAQHAEFIEAVQQLRAFTRGPDARVGDGIVFEGDGSLEVSAEGWTIPRSRAGVVDPTTGLIADGREAWLTAFAFDLVRFNPERAAAAPAVAIEVALEHARKTIKTEGRDVRRDLSDKISRALDSLRHGEIRSLPVVKEKDGKRVTRTRGVLPSTSDPALWHLPAADKRKSLDIVARSAPDATKAAQRAIVFDRAPMAEAVSEDLEAALDTVFAGVYDGKPRELKPVHVIDAPTGSGKTTKTVAYVIRDPRTKIYDEAIAAGRPDIPGPIVFSLPTYNNISEVRERTDQLQLDPTLSDADLAAQVEDMGMMSMEKALKEIAAWREAALERGVRTMVYEGKSRHCQFPDRIDALQKAGISTSGLCKSRVKQGLEFVDEFCPFYATCEAISQKKKIKTSHIVFLPHAFFALSIPEDLSEARCVIADERLFTMAVHTTQLSLSTLRDVKRAAPALGKREKEIITKGITDKKEQQRKIDKVTLDYVQDRDAAAEIAVAVFDGKAPAEIAKRWPEALDLIAVLAGDGGKAIETPKLTPQQKKFAKKVVTGTDMVHSALRVCGAGSSRNVAVRPGMDDEAFSELVARATGVEIGFEYRFWKIIEERLNALDAGTAKQSREQRFQHLRETVQIDGEFQTIESVRLSWRSELNWRGAPMLLLDASADERIITKVFAGRSVKMHRVAASMNLKTVVIADSTRSTSSLTPAADILDPNALAQAKNVHKVRAVENFLATVHANGRFLTGSAKKVRTLMRAEYLPLPHIDDLHYGAERGLNFAESHVAGLAIGRSEPPTKILDGLAAALGYDDEEELVLLDPRGDGTIDGTEPLKPTMFEQIFPMRDGSDTTMLVPQAPAGTWQRLVQIQLRDEGVRQFVGRLRPVYRGDTPVVYVMSLCVPEGLVIDDIVATDDMIPAYAPLLDASRSLGGILDAQRLHRDRPDLGTLQQFTDWFLALPAQLKASFHAVRVGKKSVGVPAHYDDALAAAAAQYPDIGELALICAAANPRVAPAGERPADAIELALGSRDQRAHAEASARERAIEWLGERHKQDTTQLPYLPGRGRYAVGVDKDGRPVMLGLSSIAMLTRPDPEKSESVVAAPVDAPPTSKYMDAQDWEIEL